METARKGEGDKVGGKVRPLPSHLSTFLSPALPPRKGAGLLLYLVLWASLPGPEAFALLPGIGWIEWRVGRLMGRGHFDGALWVGQQLGVWGGASGSPLF